MSKIRCEMAKNKILKGLEECGSISELAEKTGYSRKTIYSYLNDEEVLIQWRNNHRNNIRFINEKLENGVLEAINYMLKTLNDKETPPNIKLQASVRILEQWQKIMELESKINSRIFSVDFIGNQESGI